MNALYPMIKHLHMSLVLLSIIGFLLRFVWMVRGSALFESRFSRVAPHLIDTLLLLAGLGLALISQLNPLATAWLGTKMALLLLYILLGIFALKRAKNMRARALFCCAAVLVYAQMIGVALSKNPWGWLA